MKKVFSDTKFKTAIKQRLNTDNPYLLETDEKKLISKIEQFNTYSEPTRRAQLREMY